MDSLELYINLLQNVVDNKYKLIQMLIAEGQRLYKLYSTVYKPVYSGDLIYKVGQALLDKGNEESK